METKIVKQVRLRGKDVGIYFKKRDIGDLDIKLSLEISGKEYRIIPYLTYENRAYHDLIAPSYGKKKGIFKDYTDDDYIKHFLDSLNNGKAGFGNYLDYTSVPADQGSVDDGGFYTPGKDSKNVFSIIQDPFDPLVIPPEDEDLKTRRKLWDDYKAARDVSNKKPIVAGTPSNSESAVAPVPDEPRVDPLSVTGKLFVKKKSGPGEITGIVEAEIVNANVVFKDLQFTDPGFYVITISHGESSTLVDPIDVSIEVLAEEVVTPQEESKGVETDAKVTGNRPIIAQIDKPQIVIKPIVEQQDQLAGSNQSGITKDTGFKPLIHYQAVSLNEKDIKSLTLYHDGIVPKISFRFADTSGVISLHPPKADTTMELFLNPGSSNLKPIHFVFNVVDHIQVQGSKEWDVKGTIHVPDLYKVNNFSYTGTSFEVIRKICKDLKLGFNSNINETNDAMSWRNPNTKPHEFIEEIIAHSYIDDEAYMGGYIDYYYCFNYVDIEKEMNRDISKDVGIDTSGMSVASTPDESSRINKMILSNDKSLKESAFYFEGNYTTRNDSTKKAIRNGLLTVTKAYDRISKSFLVFSVDSTTSDGSKTIPLKGAENDKTEFDTNIRTKYTGKIDTDNVHKDYNYAITQNRINLNELNKIVLEINMPNPNFNLYKFQKINIQIINGTTTPANPEEINFRYSGEYIILNITYLWFGGKLSQKVELVRKEMGKKPEEITDPKPLEKKKEVKEINENPIGASPSVVLPNSIYTPGESYVVKDKEGRKYIVTIKSLSEDGKEVLADVKQIDGADVSLQSAGATDPNQPDGGVSTSGTPSVTPGLTTSSTTTPGLSGSVININWWN